MLLAAAAKEWLGDQGIYLLSLVSGLADVDAITLSLARLVLDDLNASVASMGIIIASATNTLVKGFLFAFFVGIKQSLRLMGVLLAAVIPGLIIAVYMI